MSNTPAERLQAARIKAGYPSRADACRVFEWKYPTVANHENGYRGIGPDEARQYARAYHVTPEWLLFGRGAEPKASPAQRPIYLRGYVQAGHWAPNHEWEFEDTDTWQEIQFPRPPRLAGLALFGLEVRGESMNRLYRPGSILICADIHDVPEPGNDDPVIVRRWADSGDVELTCKLLRLGPDGSVWLWPHSDRPEHQTPFQIRAPKIDAADGLKDRGFDFQGLAQPEEPASTLASPGQIEITARVVAHIGLA